MSDEDLIKSCFEIALKGQLEILLEESSSIPTSDPILAIFSAISSS